MKKWAVGILILISLLLLQGCIFNNQPPIIKSMAPSNGAKVNSGKITFKWEAKDPEGEDLFYDFYLFSNGLLIKEEKNLIGNEYPLDITSEGVYTWKLIVYDNRGGKTEKDIEFEVIHNNTKPIKSFLKFPENGASNIYPYNVKFQWNKSLDFDGDMVFYNLYLGNSTPLTTPIATSLEKTEYIIDKLKLNEKYYWKIVSYDSNNASETSEIWTFKTMSNTPPIIDFPQKKFIIKEGEKFELDLNNFVSDMEDNYFEYQIITNNGGYMQGSKYIFNPGYDFVKHDNKKKDFQEQILVSDSKDTSSGFLNIEVEDVNRPPEKPQIVYPLSNSIVPKDFALKWIDSDPDGDSLLYDVYIGDFPGHYTKVATKINTQEYNFALNNDKEYYLKVVAIDSYGETTASDEIKIKTQKELYKIEWIKNINNILDIFNYKNRLIVISESNIFEFSTNGDEINRISLENLISNSAIFGNKLYVPDSSGNINIIDLNSFTLENSIYVENDILGITISKDYKNIKRLYAISKEGKLSILNINTNEIEWGRDYNISPNGPVLIIENGYIVIGGTDENNKGSLLILKPKGKIFKKLSFSSPITSLISNDENSNIYFAIGKTIYKYSKEGEKIWESIVSEDINNEILYDGNNIYAASQNKIFILNLDGSLISTKLVANLFSKTLVVSENNVIYVMKLNGIFVNDNSINLNNVNEIKSYMRLSDGLLFAASNNELYTISVGKDDINEDYWSDFGKNNENNRNSYIRNNTAPNKPELLYPQNQSYEIPIKLSLSWECEDPQDDELSYDIYLGENDVPEYIATTKATSYEITLKNNKRYYWKIVSSDGEKSTESEIYSFDTIPAPAEMKFKIKVDGASVFSPAISEDNNIFISTSNGNVYEYNANGELKWKYETNGFIKSHVVLNPNNQSIVGNSNGELFIINSDGTLANKIKLDSSISKPVSLSGFGEIYVITDIGTVYKLSAFGNELWHKELGGNPTTNIVVDNSDNIYFGLNNSLYSIDKFGNERFKKDFSMSISSDLSIDSNENIYFATEENRLYSITKNGKININKYIGEEIKGSILIDNNNSIVFETLSGNLYRYYYLSDYFPAPIKLNDIPYSSILMDDVKYITTKNKFIVYNGELRWFDNYSKIKYSPNIDMNGVIIFGTIDGYLYGIYGDTPNLRNSDWPIAFGDRKHTGNINKNITMPTNRPPLKPFNPYPSDKSVLTLNSITLTWESSDPDGDSVYYDVYFGDDKNQELVAQNITQNKYTINNLSSGVYYWYVEAKDNYGNSVKSDIWSFTIEEGSQNNPPLRPTLLYPAKNQTDVPVNITLKWSCIDPDGDILTYDIYISTDPTFIVPTLSNYNSTTYEISLQPGEVYYWKVVAKDGKGGRTASEVYSFTTAEETNNPPNKPILISPTNGAEGLETNLTLYWSCEDPDGDSLTYDIYLDKTQDFVMPYKTNVGNTSLAVSGLELGTTYYWKVVAKDGKGGENSSEIYSFTIKDSEGPLTPKLYFKDVIVASGSEGELIIHGQKLENVQAFDIEISYDTSKIKISNNEIESIGEIQGRSLIINNKNGKLKITNLSFSPYTINNSDIIRIKFTAIGERGNTEVRFTNNTRLVSSEGNDILVDISDVGIITIQ